MQSEKEEREPNAPAVLYEDDEVMVVDKPCGWLTHGDGRQTDAPTVVEWFLKRQPAAAGVGEPGYTSQGVALDRSGVVHRLDRETSGVLILAKTQEAYDYLKQQFKDHLAKKEYLALVYGRVNDRWGTINRPIGRSAKDSRRRSAERGAKGVRREAVTDFERLKVGEFQGEIFSYLRLFPKTGRTHQLRVHLRAIDRPIVGDELYASHKMKNSNNLGLDRLALHAHRLSLSIPGKGEMVFISPLPEDLVGAVACVAE